MAEVPFFANTDDDTHCFQAVLRMVLKQFEPPKDYSWKELDKITNKPLGLWTWPMAGLAWLANHGYDVATVELFDYPRFINDAHSYMKEFLDEATIAEQEKHSDIPLAQADAIEFIKVVNHQNRIPDLEEIKQLIQDGFLVICNVNASILNGKPGYVGHFVLVINQDQHALTLHDPGLPAVANRKVENALFESAWAYPNEFSKNIMAIRPKSS